MIGVRWLIHKKSPSVFTILLQHVSMLKHNAKLMQMIDKTAIKFEDMPRALAHLIEKVEELNGKLESLNETSEPRQAEWMGIKELFDYLPTRRAAQTVYGWTSAHMIFHKKGKRIMFLKSEIDKWLIGAQLKSIREIESDAEAFCARKNACKL